MPRKPKSTPSPEGTGIPPFATASIENFLEPASPIKWDMSAQHPLAQAVKEITFLIGDAVYLLSGSQKMVVEKILDDGRVGVVWMVFETAEMRRDILPVAVLAKGRQYNGPK